ncbi:MAG: hypothetical protein JKY41_15400 [Rhodobacteraceae bacterium]|nr:hypothetical protein [Paracoccaceae bacterium]
MTIKTEFTGVQVETSIREEGCAMRTTNTRPLAMNTLTVIPLAGLVDKRR